MTRRLALCTLAALICLAWGAPLTIAQDSLQSGLRMTAEAAFDGMFKYGEWLPVWVELENSGSDLEAQVQVRIASGGGATVFATPVSLPSGSRKLVPVYVLPNNFSHELEVQLVQGGSTLASQKLTARPRTNNTYIIGLVAPGRGALGILQTISLPGGRPTELVDVSLDTLPERVEGLRSLDCLIINDVDTSTLTPEQRAALEGWVVRGGRLIVGGGAAAVRTAAGLSASLLPLTPGSSTEVDTLSGLVELGGSQPIRVSGPFVVATGETSTGHILATQNGLPLVVEHTVGAGYSDLVALDLAQSPFDAWSGTTDFWEHLLTPGSVYPTWLPPDASVRQTRAGTLTYALTNLPSLDLPSVQGLTILLLVYIVLVGPASYLILRRRKRLHWAWVTTPLLTLLFSAGAFGLAYAMHGTDLILNKIAILEPQPDGSARVNSYVGLFSPSQRSYDIEVMGNGLLSPLSVEADPWGAGGLNTTGEMVFVQGDPGYVSGLTVNQWSMQTFAVEGVWPDFGRVVSDLRVVNGAVAGTVRNETPYTLSDVAVVLGNDFVKLGDLSSGAEAEVHLELLASNNSQFGPPVAYRLLEEEMSQPGPVGPRRVAQLKQSVLESVFQPSLWSAKMGLSSTSSGMDSDGPKGLVLIGWLDSAPPDMRVNQRIPVEKATALVYAPLTYQFAGEGQVTIPPGLIGGDVIEMPAEGGICGSPGTLAVYIGRGQAVYQFQLPAEMQGIQADELTILLTSEGRWAVPAGRAIYDWDAAEWREYENIALGANVLSGADRLVSADGVVRVRLRSDGSNAGCYALELGVKGTW